MVIAGDFNVIPAPEDVYNPAPGWTTRCSAPETRAHFQALRQSRADRRVPRLPRRAAPLHVLGLSGRRLPEEPGPAHRPSAAVAASGRPATGLRDRCQPAELGEALGPRADLYRAGGLGLEPAGSAGSAPKPTDKPDRRGRRRAGLLKGAASAAAEAAGAAASAASPDAGITIDLGRLRLGGGRDCGRLHAAQFGQHAPRRPCGSRCRTCRTPRDRDRRSIAAPCRSATAFSCARMIKASPLARLWRTSSPRHRISPSVACEAACCFLAAVASQLTASPTFFSTPVAVHIETRETILRLGIAEIARRVAEQVDGIRPGSAQAAWRECRRR